MGCCEATNPDLLGVVSDPTGPEGQWPAPDQGWDRRTALKGLLGAAVGALFFLYSTGVDIYTT